MLLIPYKEKVNSSYTFRLLHLLIMRSVSFSRCLTDEGCLTVPDLDGYLVVLQPDAPQVQLAGSPRSAHPVSDFQVPLGVPIFPDLRITCTVSHNLSPNKLERAPRSGGRHV